MNRLYIIIKGMLAMLAMATFAACTDSEESNDMANADARLLQGLSAGISGGENATTRASLTATTEKEPLYVGRSSFVGGDEIIMTKFVRTDNPISDFSYNGLTWEKKTDESGWTRADESTKIYWSDAKSAHTFIGYSLPSKTFSWTKIDGTDGAADTYSAQLTLTSDNSVNYTNYTEDEETKSGNLKMKADDVVLAYNTNVVADATGIATVDFRHALSCLTVVLNISGFSATTGVGEDEGDNATRVTQLTVYNQPYKYKWTQGSDAADVDDETATANIHAWTNSVDGDPNTKGRNRRFYYHSLMVPGKREKVEMDFTVTYPDPLDNTKTLTNTYTATAENVEFTAGKRTTINISLNHKDEKITVGAEYDDWEYQETPDQGSLAKNGTYLSSTSMDNVILHDKTGLIRDDATWLYMDGNNIVDIYGNDGSESKPYTISTANQLLAFAYEVNQGKMDFKDKYVRLDANLYLQPSTSASSIEWIGIGNDTYPFKGHFDGGLRDLRRLNGKSLFGAISSEATVEGVRLYQMVGTTDGGSVVANNAGTITGCWTNGDVKNANGDAGGICAKNTGTISVCSHIGAVTATNGCAATIAGNNDGGTVKACYAGCGLSGTTTSVQCYYDKGMYASENTDVISKYGKTTSEMTQASFVTTLNTEAGEKATYKFVHQPSEYPDISKKENSK